MTAHHSNATLILISNYHFVIMVRETSSIARVRGGSAPMASTLQSKVIVNQSYLQMFCVGMDHLLTTLLIAQFLTSFVLEKIVQKFQLLCAGTVFSYSMKKIAHKDLSFNVGMIKLFTI